MAKKVAKQVKLQIDAGRATPAPPVGTILGPLGINTGDFCSKFNEQTKDKMGDILPVEVTVYADRSFDFVIKTPPAGFLIAKYAKIKSGSKNGCKEEVGSLTQDQLREIATIKLPDLNAASIEAAMKIVAGTAKNMGVKIEDK